MNRDAESHDVRIVDARGDYAARIYGKLIACGDDGNRAFATNAGQLLVVDCEGELHELNGPQALEDWYEGSVLALAMNAVGAEYVREIGRTS